MPDSALPLRKTPRSLTPAQQVENAAFLEELRRTGNARLAARRLGAHRAKFTKRRAKHPCFAAQWEAALDFADARLARDHPQVQHRSDSGRLQLRAARCNAAGIGVRMTFLGALSAGLDVRLAAAFVGFSHAAFYYYKNTDPAFASKWNRARRVGRLELEPEKPPSKVPWPYEYLDETIEEHRREIYAVAEAVYDRPDRRSSRTRSG
jgi:hypothetical protein